MFEPPPSPEELCSADDAAVVAAIEQWNRIEAAASAQRLDAIAELTSRRCDKEGERASWACDGWDSVAGEVAAALRTSPRKASSQMQLALTLRQRLPKLAALYLDGQVSHRVVSAIAWHTHLVDDDATLGYIDGALSARAAVWGELPDYKLAQSIDYWVDRHDPAAVRRGHARARTRDLYIGNKDDESDTTAVWGRLYATDAAVLDRRLLDMAHGVCDADPRTIRQRRADALGALAAGADRLACNCGNPECPFDGNDGRASNVVVHVVTEASALEVKTDGTQTKPSAGLMFGGQIVPTPLLAELIRNGAKVRQVCVPDSAPEPGYLPSAKLAEFVRVRDMTCRFPGCEEPAEFCDIDHTIPYPVGPTHPSNLKCVCRKHHLLKTFWTGIGGWADQQLADGTVIWTAPTGRIYTTLPGSRLFFPAWSTTTAALPARRTTAQCDNRGVMMPRRRQTRAVDRARRIQEERALNIADIANMADMAEQRVVGPEHDKPPPIDPWDFDVGNGAYDDDPPPF